MANSGPYLIEESSGPKKNILSETDKSEKDVLKFATLSNSHFNSIWNLKMSNISWVCIIINVFSDVAPG